MDEESVLLALDRISYAIQDIAQTLAAIIPSKTDVDRERGGWFQASAGGFYIDQVDSTLSNRGEGRPAFIQLRNGSSIQLADAEYGLLSEILHPSALTARTTRDQSDPPTLKDFAGAPGNRIGVFDYNSLVECLRLNFKIVFPNLQITDNDPQNMVQFLTAEIQRLRRQFDA